MTSAKRAGSPKAARLRARRRRRLIRRVRLRGVSALRTAALRAERVPPLARTLRAGGQRLERAGKRLERLVAADPGRARPHTFDPLPEAAARELQTLIWARSKELVRVDQPLVLISQAPRSGGTLLMQLFDGHPECYAIAHELGAMLPSRLPLPRDPAAAWRVLADHRLVSNFEVGLRQAKGRQAADRSFHPFLLPPILHRGLFEHCVEEMRPETDRGILDCYLTAYFNAWLDYPLSAGTRRRWVTGFEPAAVLQLGPFRELYPDGRLVSVVREPAGWAVSALRRRRRYPTLEVAMETWRECVTAALAARAETPGAVAIVPFESLVGETERTMRALAGFLEVEYRDELLEPTLLGVPMKANSSFPVEGAGVIDAPLRRGEQLAPDDAAVIERTLGDLHRQALEVALVSL